MAPVGGVALFRSAQQPLDDVGGRGERRSLRLVQRRDLGGERRHAALPALVEQTRAFCSGVQPHDPAVIRIVLAPDEPVALHPDDQAGRRRRADLFGGGELAERDRSAEDHDGQRRGARRRQAHGVVLPPQAAEQVDRGGVQAVGDGKVDGAVGRVAGRTVDGRYLHMLSMYLA